MAATLFSSMKLKYFAKDTADSYHVISWPDFLKFMGTATKSVFSNRQLANV